MVTLNLIDSNISDIKYNIIHFPDGEIQICLENLNRKVNSILIKTRISSLEDLFILKQVGDILNRQEISFKIMIYYLMGMRMDRVMDFNKPFTLKIIAEIINSLDAYSVGILEPHSAKSCSLINRAYHFYSYSPFSLTENYTLVFPDAGAAERYEYAAVNPIICSKVRDVNTGELKSFSINNPSLIHNSDKPLMIIDDLCDGGGTFIGIAKLIREIDPEVNLNITVTHMVNEKGIKNLSNNFNKVFITNSYKDWNNLPDNVSMLNINEI